MDLKQFDYELPEELIAQDPLSKRDSSRLLVVSKTSNELKDDTFSNIFSYLKSGDCLVLNDTKVFPARLYGKKESTLAKIEVLMLEEKSKDVYECLVKPAKRIKEKDIIIFSPLLIAECVGVLEEGIRLLLFKYNGILLEILESIGEVPLPPYIHKKLHNKNRYNTIYASFLGSAAAPTAGLHFTNELLEKISSIGVTIVKITLHVGLGTFRPVMEDDIMNHKMHEEKYIITKESAIVLNEAVKNNKRIIAVGTTVIRTLESNYNNGFTYGEYRTNIFIYPGYKFKIVDALITNFHLPKSTLIMLVSAFSSLEIIKNAYKHAVDNKYRFFSFGDSMFIS
ncbi:MAG: tRNA preQ1(34) S-adenosylmethionine ribosyltransferase-isomerase QueA [Acholeplasmatales bacterium]|jgi:S-adenosylmethionine:tRNA ribosyltransferase-isomerase|nr:tRNA preQ1(34) S-adenosylmethionine ribosyltransferase-isomerase QueA [Acholeplasmatales bacterium]